MEDIHKAIFGPIPSIFLGNIGDEMVSGAD